MRSFILTLTTLAAVWLEISFLGALRPFGVLPNLFLIMVILVGLIGTASETVAVALAGGLLLDLASGADFGFHMAFYVLLGLLVVYIKRSGANFDHIGWVLAITLGGTMVYNLAVLAGLVATGVVLPGVMAASRVGREAILNLLVMLATRPLLAKLLSSPRQRSFIRGAKGL